MEVRKIIHKHPLVLITDENAYINKAFFCDICGHSNIAAPFYTCKYSCGRYYHKSCAELPTRVVNHSKHPSHPLLMVPRGKFTCGSCGTHRTSSYPYTCFTCRFNLDIDCAMMGTITFTKLDQDSAIRHSTHSHPMSLVNPHNQGGEINCAGCQSSAISTSGDRVYGCTKCKYFLHKSCAEFPKEIQYPFHLDHGPLTLHIQYFGFSKCALCNKSYKTIFTFKCSGCSLQLCLKCSAVGMRAKGTIKYKYHEHLLCFASEGSLLIENNICDSSDCHCKQSRALCSKEFSDTSSCIFYCLECNFKLHFLCGSLPSAIEYEFHNHSLILRESLDEDNSEEHYCDICELEREPRIRVYRCVQCKYVAHIHCLISQIANILRGDLKDVELKTIGDDIWKSIQEQDKSPSTLHDIINALPESEKELLNSFFVWDDASSSKVVKEQPKKRSTNLGDDDVDWITHLSSSNYATLVSDMVFPKMQENTWELKSKDLGLKLVTVEDYKIPYTVAPVLKTILDKYGDISSDSHKISSKEGKSVVYFILCQVLKKMGSTKVADVTKDLLIEWAYPTFIIHRKFGFKLDFLKERVFGVIVPAFAGAQAKRLEDEIPIMISGQLAKLQQVTMKLNSQLERCNEFSDKSSPKSEFMLDCLDKASQWKWKNVCEGLF